MMIDAQPILRGVPGINKIFEEIDCLQTQALRQIGLLIKEDAIELDISSEETPYELTVKNATSLIQKIPDLISVIDLKISQLPSSVVADHFLRERLDLYHGKVRYLRQRLKDSQLVAYGEENVIIHEQRLREFCPSRFLGEKESADPVNAKSALFAGRSSTKGSDSDDKKKKISEQVLTQNKSITASLQQSKQLMEMSVMQTELNIDTLDQQSKDLTQLNHKLIDMEMVLTKSKQIVKFIEKQDKHDKRRIYAAIGFLLLCSAWVLWRRVLKMPFKILLWALLKMFGIVNSTTSIIKRNDSPIAVSISVASNTVDAAMYSVSSSSKIYLGDNLDPSETKSLDLVHSKFPAIATEVDSTSTHEVDTFNEDMNVPDFLRDDSSKIHEYVSQDTHNAELVDVSSRYHLERSSEATLVDDDDEVEPEDGLQDTKKGGMPYIEPSPRSENTHPLAEDIIGDYKEGHLQHDEL